MDNAFSSDKKIEDKNMKARISFFCLKSFFRILITLQTCP